MTDWHEASALRYGPVMPVTLDLVRLERAPESLRESIERWGLPL